MKNIDRSASCIRKPLAKAIGAALNIGAVAVVSIATAGLASAQTNGTVLEEVVVQGIRGSLQQASEIKRNSAVISDVISAEDIGKFPDQNLAESLQRVSGVQISRNRGEGEDVTVRGLSPDFTRVQFNGRTLPSATGGRSFDFTIMPADFVSAVEVYKTPTADMEEGALSATINVRTARPLDARESSLVTSIKLINEDNSGETDPDASFLYTKVSDDGKFGFSLGAHYDKRSVESHIYEAFGIIQFDENDTGPTPTLDYNLDGDTDDSYRFNAATNFSQLNEERERTTLLGTFQWRPTDNADIWLETLYSEFDTVGSLPLNSFRWVNVIGSVTDSSIVTDPLGSDGLLERLEIDGVDHRNNARTTDSNDKLTSVSLGTNYSIDDNWTLEAELSYATSENLSSRLSHEVIGRANAFIDFSGNYGGLPEIDYVGGYDSFDGSNFRSIGFNGNLDQLTSDENVDLRIDLDRTVDWSFGSLTASSVEFGAKYSAREKFNGYRRLGVSAEVLAGLLGETYDASIEGGSFDAGNYMSLYSPSGFLDGYDGPVSYPTEWLSADVESILEVVSLSELVSAGTITEGGSREINVKEDVLSAYAKLNFEGSDGKLTGNFGVRVVSTDQESAGNIPDFSTVTFDQGGATTDVQTSESSVSRSYTEVLPSLNVRYDLTDEVVLRFGAARVMSRPSLDVLSPATSININVGTINSSNPDVDPFLADQLDFAAEWYFEDGGLVSVAPFVKFVESFVVSSTISEQVTYSDPDGSNSRTTTLTRFLPDNGRGSDLVGIEFNFQKPLDMLVEGLGVAANLTLVDADEIQAADGGPFFPIDGLSEKSYNLVAYYENEKFGARLAYNYRDGFVNNGTNYFGDGSFTEDYSQLDLSASYNLSENVSIDFEALNITDEVISQVNTLGINRGLEDVGKRLTLGVRAKF